MLAASRVVRERDRGSGRCRWPVCPLRAAILPGPQVFNQETSLAADSLYIQPNAIMTTTDDCRISPRGQRACEEVLDGAVAERRLVQVGGVAGSGDRHPRRTRDLARHVVGGD